MHFDGFSVDCVVDINKIKNIQKKHDANAKNILISEFVKTHDTIKFPE